MRPKFRQVGNFPVPPPARILASEPGASPPRRPGLFPPAGLRPSLSSPEHRNVTLVTVSLYEEKARD
jgi:hypothetical protein